MLEGVTIDSSRPSYTSSHKAKSETKGNSLKCYASKVFEESSVGLISRFTQTTSTRRKIFKILVLILCLTGFLYQSGKYLSVVLHYPTTIDVDVLRPDTYTIPAYTFCDNNGINRRLFCEKYPDRCEEPDNELCKKYPRYCGENNTVVPKTEYYRMYGNINHEEMLDVVDLKRNIILHGSNEEINGPYLRLKDDTQTYVCYSVNDRINTSMPALTFSPDRIMRRSVNKISFNVREDEMFLPGNRAGLVFALHSPFEAVNPFETGIFMKPGRTYMVYVSMEEEIMEKTPYDTECVNYTEIWERNGHIGPRLQSMCRQNCLSDVSVKCLNCNLPLFIYPRHEKFCNIRDKTLVRKNTCGDKVMEMAKECTKKCKDDCQQTKLRYNVQERFQGHFNEKGNFVKERDSTIDVHVYLEGDEIIVFKHSPKYMTVEVFSSIGGFIGIWLGMSLLDVTDISEGLFRIFRFSLKKR